MAKRTPKTTIDKLSDLTPDPFNANLGTERGAHLLGVSLEEHGAARGIVVDKHGLVISGNKTLDAAVDRGLGVTVVQTSGDRLIVVQRTDLDADTPEAAKLAYLDNRTSEVGLKWNPLQIETDLANGLELGTMWSETELTGLLAVLDERERVLTILFDDRAQRSEWRKFLGTLTARYPDPPGASVAHRLLRWITDQSVRLDAEDASQRRKTWQDARAARTAKAQLQSTPELPEETA